MGQVLKQDKIGLLSEAGGTITLQPSTLTIGGQQYSTTSPLQTTPSGLVASTWYRVYAVMSAGNVIIISSSNNNSTGPATYDSWKLVGHYFSSRLNNPVNVNAATIDGYVNRKPFICKIGNNANQSGYDTNYQKVQVNEAEFDDFDMADVGNDQIIIPIRSKYTMRASLATSALSGNEHLDFRLLRNTSQRAFARTGGPTSNHSGAPLNVTDNPNTGDTISIEVRSVGDADFIAVGTGSLSQTYLEVIEQLPNSLIKDEDL